MRQREYYCKHCKNFLGTSWVSPCPHCGANLNKAEFVGSRWTTTRRQVITRTVVIGSGLGICSVSVALSLSTSSVEWATFFISLVASLLWQLSITILLLELFISIVKALLSERVIAFLWNINNIRIATASLKIRQIANLLARHKRTGIIFLMITASTVSLYALNLIFERPLDIYNISFTILTNILGSLFVLLLIN